MHLFLRPHFAGSAVNETEKPISDFMVLFTNQYYSYIKLYHWSFNFFL